MGEKTDALEDISDAAAKLEWVQRLDILSLDFDRTRAWIDQATSKGLYVVSSVIERAVP